MPHHIRWMTSRDLHPVALIEAATFAEPCTAREVYRTLRSRTCIGMVAEINDRIDGYMVYELHDAHLSLLLFGVAPDARRRGVGTRLLDHLKYKCYSHRRDYLTLDVIDTETPAHLFLRYNDFRAVAVRGPLYRFEWHMRDGDREHFEREQSYSRLRRHKEY